MSQAVVSHPLVESRPLGVNRDRQPGATKGEHPTRRARCCNEATPGATLVPARRQARCLWSLSRTWAGRECDLTKRRSLARWAAFGCGGKRQQPKLHDHAEVVSHRRVLNDTT